MSKSRSKHLQTSQLLKSLSYIFKSKHSISKYYQAKKTLQHPNFRNLTQNLLSKIVLLKISKHPMSNSRSQKVSNITIRNHSHMFSFKNFQHQYIPIPKTLNLNFRNHPHIFPFKIMKSKHSKSLHFTTSQRLKSSSKLFKSKISFLKFRNFSNQDHTLSNFGTFEITRTFFQVKIF